MTNLQEKKQELKRRVLSARFALFANMPTAADDIEQARRACIACQHAAMTKKTAMKYCALAYQLTSAYFRYHNTAMTDATLRAMQIA